MDRAFRAWRFLHPVLDVPQEFAGLQISPTGGIEMVEDDASIRQAILLLLSTRPGERVMRPDYGCDLERLVFWPNDDTTAGLAIHYVRTALDRWEPRIQILRLQTARTDADPGRLEIGLTYQIRANRRADSLQFSVGLAGERD
jgi:hypothetical protein